MTNAWIAKPTDESSLAAIEEIDRICLAFEETWRQGAEVRLENYLASAAAELRRPLLVELLRLELFYRRYAGQVVEHGELTNRFPGYEAEVERVLADVQTMSEDVASDTHQEGNPLPADSERFRVLRMHAEGGLGRVFVAYDRQLKREVALKEINPRLAGDRTRWRRFIREAEITGGLEHPNIVPVYELGTGGDGQPYYAMRLIRGYSLKEVLLQFHREPRPRDRRWQHELRKLLGRFLAVCQAVEYAHSRGIVHRDLKPSNIMLGDYGETLVVDWGLAKYTGEAEPLDLTTPDIAGSGAAGSSALTALGSTMGTPAYMSPEQAAGRGDAIGALSDVYSLGATLYAILSGRPPIASGDATTMLDAVATGNWRPLREVNRHVPPALDAICRRAMALAPTDRYPSALALAEDIERWLDHDAVLAYREPGRERAMRWISRHQSLTATVVATVVVGLCVTLAAMWQSSRQRQVNRLETLVQSIRTAELTVLPQLLRQLQPVGPDAEQRLHEVWETSKAGSSEQLNVSLGLLEFDDGQTLDLVEQRMLAAEPSDLLVLRELLRPYAAELVPRCWQRLADEQDDRDRRIRVACALAGYAPHDARWKQLGQEVAQLMVLENLLVIGNWVEGFRPVRGHLLDELQQIYQQQSREEQGRIVSVILAEYFVDQPELLVNLLIDAESGQLEPLVRQLAAKPEESTPYLLRAVAATELPKMDLHPSDNGAKPRIKLAWQRARAAVALLAVDRGESVWPLLSHSPDPTLRSCLIHSCAPAGLPPEMFVAQFRRETDVSRKRALLMILGEYLLEDLPTRERPLFVDELSECFRHDPNPGLHAAAAWLLRQWGHDAIVIEHERELTLQPASGEQRWYVNSQQQTMVIVDGPVEFLMGSPWDEWNRDSAEIRHRRRIDRGFAIAATEVTAEQLLEVLGENPTYGGFHGPEPACPATSVSWYTAAKFCRRLSESEGIPESQMCFPPVEQIGPGMTLPEDCLERSGYRLPTAAEWEYACRAGTVSSTYFGDDRSLAPHYCSGQSITEHRSRPVGLRKPNDLGLFDMYSNVEEWTISASLRLSEQLDANTTLPDTLQSRDVADRRRMIVRGTSFHGEDWGRRSAARNSMFPHVASSPVFGFRMARTMSAADEVSSQPNAVPMDAAPWEIRFFGPGGDPSPLAVMQSPTLALSRAEQRFPEGVPAEHFTAIATRDLALPAGYYDLAVYSDDGARVWIDDHLVVDLWDTPSPRSGYATHALTGGAYPIRVEYFQATGEAFLYLDMQPHNLP